MKRKSWSDISWKDVQASYDAGHTVSDICRVHCIGINSWVKAKRAGLILTCKRKSKPRVTKVSLTRSARINYREACRFKFNLSDYPNEFDFSLIEKHGWYSAANNGNNLGGISRDHGVSVKYGFENGVPSEHIAHPANCILMIQNLNSSKKSRNAFSYPELVQRIRSWDSKYAG